jgi:protein TonB
MPPTLFREGEVRTSLNRSRGSPLVLSVTAHAAIFVAIATVSLSTSVELPAPRDRMSFFDQPVVRMADITLPVPTPKQSVVRSDSQPPAIAVVPPEGTPEVPTAPLVAPAGIAMEAQGATPVPGVRGGDPDARMGIRNTEKSSDSFGVSVPIERVAPPPPPPRTPVRLHSGMKAPVKIFHVDPVYPVVAQSARIQGVVILEATIDASGTVQAIKVLRPLQMLDRAASEAVRQWRYEPGELNGVRVPVIMSVTVAFTLRQ